MRGRSGNDPRMIRATSEQETVRRNPPRNRGYFSRPPRAFCIEKYNISRSGYHSKFHRILRLPRKVTLQLHRILRLPRKVTLKRHQIVHLPRKVTLEQCFFKLYPALYTGSMPTRMPPHAYADCTGCLRPRFLILGAYAGASAGFFVG